MAHTWYFHSVFHMKYPPQKGYVRACIKSKCGGYVITPVNQGKHSIVKHMLAVDWKYWKLYLRPSSARAITVRMLERLAALRELFAAKVGDSSSGFSSSSRDLRHFELPQSEMDEIKTEIQSPEEMKKIKEAFSKGNEVEMPRASLIGLNDAVDEFFDVPEPAELDHYENEWSADLTSPQHSMNMSQTKLSSAAVFVKKLHDLSVQKKGGYAEIPELPREESMPYSYGSPSKRYKSFFSLQCGICRYLFVSDTWTKLFEGPPEDQGKWHVDATGWCRLAKVRQTRR